MPTTIDRLLGVVSLMLNKEKKDAVKSQPEIVFKEGLTIIKGDSGYKWLGIYSNSFRDDDNVPEIISSGSHKEFVTSVDGGTYQQPDLLLWHVPEWKFGKATFVAYDEVEPGVVFAIAGGTIDEGKEFVADALLESGEQWQMSHGMPTDKIRRSDVDDTIYDKHVTTEVSVLSGIHAANHLTGFGVLEDDMIPTKKRDEIMGKLGVDDGFLDKLEAKNVNIAAQAKDDKEFKEVTDETAKDSEDIVTDVVAEATDVVESTETIAEEIVAEVAEEVPDETAHPEATLDVQSLMDELSGVKEVIVDLVNAVKMINDSQKETDDEIKAIKKEKADEVVAQTPTFSQVYGAKIKSIIGQKEAEVVSTDEKMTGPPEEKATSPVETKYGSFVDGLVAKSRIS